RPPQHPPPPPPPPRLPHPADHPRRPRHRSQDPAETRLPVGRLAALLHPAHQRRTRLLHHQGPRRHQHRPRLVPPPGPDAPHALAGLRPRRPQPAHPRGIRCPARRQPPPHRRRAAAPPPPPQAHHPRRASRQPTLTSPSSCSGVHDARTSPHPARHAPARRRSAPGHTPPPAHVGKHARQHLESHHPA